MRFARLKNQIQTEAARLGFSIMGVTTPESIPHYEAYLDWIQQGYHAGMNYLAREDNVAKRADPNLILPECKSIISLAMPYQPAFAAKNESNRMGKGRISSYAIAKDYHEIIWEKLTALEQFIIEIAGEKTQTRGYVDTGPILEKSLAVKAGLGQIGKNSCLIIPGAGSYFFLAEILTDLSLPTDEPFQHDLCKNCKRCIEACPTNCILPNRSIDANRCVSYLTIENREEIPEDLRKDIGSWFFGCDVCQIVCPHNARRSEKNPVKTGDTPLLPTWIDLMKIINQAAKNPLTPFEKTPVMRAKRRGILRNAAVILGNQKFQTALPSLKKAAAVEQDPVVKTALIWAIKKITGSGESANH